MLDSSFMPNSPRMPIFSSLQGRARDMIFSLGIQYFTRHLESDAGPVTHAINFRRPQDILHWLKAAHVIMRWSIIHTGDALPVEDLSRQGHLFRLFAALREWDIVLNGSQKRRLIRDYEND